MRIVIDLQGAQTAGSRNRGIGRYTAALTDAIIRNAGGHDVHVLLNAVLRDSTLNLRRKYAGVLPKENIHSWEQLSSIEFGAPSSKARRQASQLLREFAIRRIEPDIVHITSLFEGLSGDGTSSIGKLYTNINTSATLYDLIPLINAKDYLADAGLSRWYFERIDQLRRADGLLAISESARQEAIHHLGFPEDHAFNIGTAADPHFKAEHLSPTQESRIRAKFGLLKPFIMYTGGIDLRKNIERLIEAFAKLPTDIRGTHQLAIVCSAQESDRQRLLRAGKDVGLGDGDLVLTGFVEESDLVNLYNLSKLFVFPSWHEGFGLPALEAMHCDVPVVASNLSSLPEVVGMKEAMFDPFSVDQMSEVIARGLTDADFRDRLIRNGRAQRALFDWDESGKRAIAAFEAIGEKRTAAVSVRDFRPTMAYVSPLPPQKTGIADYSAELLTYLSRYYQIDCVVDSRVMQDIDFALCPEAMNLVGSDEFGKSWKRYDRILYHFGNSAFHDYMFHLLAVTSGSIVLHDFFLSGVSSYRDWNRKDPGTWDRDLYLSHGYPALLHRRNAEDPYDAVWAYPASRSVIQQADAVIVHSSNSRALAENWYGPDLAKKLFEVPHLRVPHAHDFDEHDLRAELGFDAGDLIVCAFGLIGPTKRSHELVESWLSSTLAPNKTCKLVFVGQNDSGAYGEALKTLIDGSNNGSRITITGWTDAETFQKYLRIADIAVQLRTLSRGETSGTVLDSMNYSVPLIVNDNGGMAALAGNAAVVIPDDFAQAQLSEALDALGCDEELRAQLGTNGRMRILNDHRPETCAIMYRDVIERANEEAEIETRLIKGAAWLGLSNHEMGQFSSTLATLVADDVGRLFVDVSALARGDAGTGIQRVVRNVLVELLKVEFKHLRVEPVFVDPEAGRFRYARSFTAAFLDVPLEGIEDEIVDFAPRDVILLLDLNPVLLTFATEELAKVRSSGVKVATVVYDLLPITLPEFFPDDAESLHRSWLEIVAENDKAICISESVAKELRDYLNAEDPSAEVEIVHFPLGTALDQSTGAQKDLLPLTAKREPLGALRFLMVGTVEPRKGHLDALEAFEKIWSDGVDAELQIVGKKGWKSDQIVDEINRLSDLYPLKWSETVSDDELAQLYERSDCLISASFGEGFGLPLVEAATRGLNLIVRDIPVFREVCGSGAIYFDDDLEVVLREWIANPPKAEEATSLSIQNVSWTESVDALLEQLFPKRLLEVRT